jgi:putative FmdB family regulatory protein
MRIGESKMPIFEYECSKCLKQKEMLFLSSEKEEEVRCESCNKSMIKLISSSYFQLRGKDGWYKPSAISSKED